MLYYAVLITKYLLSELINVYQYTLAPLKGINTAET